MAKRASETTKQYLESVPLPNHASTYTVISHKHIIDTTLQLLKDNGLEVLREMYKTGKGGDIAIGKYYLKSDLDPELEMLFTWGNSYNKQMRFKCLVGANVIVSSASIIAGDTHSSWNRKHTGTALEECTETIKTQISNANAYYIQLIKDKQEMKDVIISGRDRAQLLGRIIFEKDMLTLEQVGILKAELKTPSFDYGTDKSSLFNMYMDLVVSLKKAHPRFWMDQQKQIHFLLCNEFSIGNYSKPGSIGSVFLLPITQPSLQSADVLDPAQIDLEDSIAEIEQELNQELDLTVSTDILSISEIKEKFGDSIPQDQLDKIEEIISESPFKEESEVNMGTEDLTIDDLTPAQLLQIEENIRLAEAEKKASEPEIDFNL